MRPALLKPIIVMVLLLALAQADAWAKFDCFDTPQGQRRCACIGETACGELQKSDSCQSELKCDKGELGAVICSCLAARSAKTQP